VNKHDARVVTAFARKSGEKRAKKLGLAAIEFPLKKAALP
jgi:hypothetical protein